MTLSTKKSLHPSATHWIQFLSIATVVATFGLIVLGSAVRVTNSGMGCKSWPLCSGQVSPISQFHPLMEQSHRYLASIVTVLICVLAFVVLRAGASARHLRLPALASVGVIVVQIALGAITVFTTNAPITVALHLLVATMFLGAVTLTMVASFVEPERSWSLWHRPTRLAWAAVISLYLVVISGSVVVNGGAQSACPSWPLCFSSTSSRGLVTLQLVHRSFVLIGSVVVVAFLVTLLRSKATDKAERDLSLAAVVLLVSQILVGALSALNSSRTELADVHLALASALWGVVVAVFALSARERREAASVCVGRSDSDRSDRAAR